MKKTTLLIMGSLLFIAVMTGLAVSTAPAQSSWTPPPLRVTSEVANLQGGWLDLLFCLIMLAGPCGVIGMHHFVPGVRKHYGGER